jgi:hypothetical protein
MHRAWEVWKTAGGVALLVVACVYLAGSAQRHRPLKNGREFAAAVDRITGVVVRKVRRGVDWVSAQGASR